MQLKHEVKTELHQSNALLIRYSSNNNNDL